MTLGRGSTLALDGMRNGGASVIRRSTNTPRLDGVIAKTSQVGGECQKVSSVSQIINTPADLCGT